MSTPHDLMPPTSFYEEMAKDCRCCPECESVPCDGVCAGGVCDLACSCDELRDAEDEGRNDPNACPGCGGNCQVACR